MSSAGRASAALLFGNFVIGSGVLVVPGMLNELASGLRVSVPAAGQLLGLAALVMCVGAPLAAAFTSRIDRRVLLVASLAIYCAGHAACALAEGFVQLAFVRAFSVIGAAVFTPQAAATIGLLVPPERRSAAVTTIFIGWSIASVAGMPLGSVIAGYLDWRAGFLLVAGLSAVAAVWVARVVPRGLTVPPLSAASWLAVARSRRLVLVLTATMLWCAGQFTLLGYIAPSLRHLIGASPTTLAALMAVNGACGVLGNAVMSRQVGRLGTDRAAGIALAFVCTGTLTWSLAATFTPHAGTLALALALWGLGSFAFVSAQQARLAVSAPALASASIALNSSSLYAGQAIGATLGGLVVSLWGYLPLGGWAFGITLAALGLSAIAARTRAPAG